MRCTYILCHYVTPRLCVCVTGSGPGCSDLDAADLSSSTSSSSDVDVVYYYDAARGGELRANASCRRLGHVFVHPPSLQSRDDAVWHQRSSISVYCAGFVWSEAVPTGCVG